MNRLTTRTINLANIHLRVHSDLQFPSINSNGFIPYLTNNKTCHADFSILQLPKPDNHLKRIKDKDIQQLMKVDGFQQRWTRSAIVNALEVHRILEQCTRSPEYCFIEMAWDRMLIFNFKLNRFYLFYPSSRKQDILGPLFFAGFRNLIRVAFPNHSAIMIHGAGVAIHGKAAIFLAQDEGGKTTLTKCFHPKNILNDDQIILKKKGKSYYSFGTPFGTVGKNFLQHKIGGFFLLKKAKTLKIFKIRKVDVMEFLWDEHFSYTITMPKIIRIKIFKIISEIISNSQCFVLEFPKKGIKDSDIQRLVESSISE